MGLLVFPQALSGLSVFWLSGACEKTKRPRYIGGSPPGSFRFGDLGLHIGFYWISSQRVS
jgi:hypothetical protein